jgi:3-hydroxymyristoyl/3-hydroxydecanoyl-(acyl carrier protein) dehydratase
VDALRGGDLAACFGTAFAGMRISESLRLPGGRMKLIDRITDLDPEGGRCGLGRIRAEADIHPDDWFLTCHFVDDMTMPGTLMYECCAHTLRVFLQRMGWISDRSDVHYEPVPGVKSVLKCRGPVTPRTRTVVYEVEITSFGYGPEPYAVADAHMFADGRYIVQFKDMALKVAGLTQGMLEDLWADRNAGNEDTGNTGPLFDRSRILEFSVGKPSRAFGPAYRPFDDQRFIARLPAPPYSFIDRIVRIEPPAWQLAPDGWIEAEFDLRADHWYFRADRGEILPFCILLEAALQSCGWLAAYMGSALKSEQDLKFRNLDGEGLLHQNLFRQDQTLRTRCRLKKSAVLGDTIIETFDFGVFLEDRPVYEGTTSFGFFAPEALIRQKGIPASGTDCEPDPTANPEAAAPIVFDDPAPRHPDDADVDVAASLAMPSKALRMIDRIDCYQPRGGPAGLGWVRGVKDVDPDEWFFKAHFFQDPVCPGSLGIESLLQLLKFVAMQRWPEKIQTHRFRHRPNRSHRWKYRGQIVPENRRVIVDAFITRIDDGPDPEIYADGRLWVDGLCIYKMENFALRLAHPAEVS